MASDTSAIRRLLQDNLRRSGIALFLLYVISLSGSMILTASMLNHSARQLSRTLRNELLVGNNSYATKIINQNMQGQFERVEYLRDNRLLFSLHAQETTPKVLMNAVRVPICLNLEQDSCESTLVFRYSMARYFLVITLMAAGMLLFSLVSFLLFRKRLLRVFRQTLTAQKEAALGRLSAQICHDLKLPSLIFQRIAQVESWQEFNPLRPQLDEHVRRLFSMIDKLKRLDLEGLVRPEPFTLQRAELESFLHSVLRKNKLFTLTMPDAIPLVADRDKLERTLANLVLNAEQAGAVRIDVEWQIQGSDLRIRVVNNGPEVPAAIVEWFSDPAGRASRVPVGLGLMMVRDTIWGHGGSCQLQSTGDRTVFELTFPHAVQNTTAMAAPTQSLSPRDETPPPVQEPRAPGLWIDSELRPFLESDMTPAQRQHFLVTSDPNRLHACVLVVSGQMEVIAAAIEQNIPTFYHHGSSVGSDLRSKFQKRLKLLRPFSDSARPSDAPRSPGPPGLDPHRVKPTDASVHPLCSLVPD